MAKNYTKDLIQLEFVKMLNEKKLNKITVKDLCINCEINRNTFYYYYSDIYDILMKLFEDEEAKVISEYNDTLSWEESFLAATKFIQENKTAVYHIYDSLKRKELENYIDNLATNVMQRYVDSMSFGLNATEQDKKEIAYFYRSALIQMVIDWIDNNLKDKPEEVIRRIGLLFDGNIKASLERSERLNKNK